MLEELPDDQLSVPRGVQIFTEQAVLNLLMANDTIIESCVNQTFYTNQCRQEEHLFREGELVYLSTEKFIGPYPILSSRPELSTYELHLPDSLKSRRIHLTFHVSQLW